MTVARSPLSRSAARLLLVVLAMLGAGCGSGGDAPAAPPRDRAAGDHLVTVVTAQRVDLGTDQERPGTLRYRKLVRLYSQEEGRVTRLDLYEGDRVSQDQVLVQLEDDLLRAELDKAGATQAQKRLDLRRLEDLQRKRAASDDEVAQAATALALADADLRLLRVRLGYTRIAAPFPGVITERRVEPGDFVTKNTHLLTLADPESLVAEVYASELILPQVRVGDPARLRVDALGASEHAARVLRIHPELEPASRQGIVELVLTPVPAGARAGQFVRVTLKTESRERLILPFRAMHRDREGEFVWLVTPEEKAARQPVRSGLRAAEGVEILEGLDPGARVITRGFLGLTDGKAVKIVAG